MSEGGGRQRALRGLEGAFLEVLRNPTAGSPVNETLNWTHRKRGEMAAQLAERGFRVSVTVVDQRLEKHNFRARRGGKTDYRDEPFKNIERLKEESHGVIP